MATNEQRHGEVLCETAFCSLGHSTRGRPESNRENVSGPSLRNYGELPLDVRPTLVPEFAAIGDSARPLARIDDMTSYRLYMHHIVGGSKMDYVRIDCATPMDYL